MMAEHKTPGWVTTKVLNRLVVAAARRGVSLAGCRVLRVVGRNSGVVRSVPVNVLSLDDDRYLVSARGETDWVRNIRRSGSGELVLGRAVEKVDAFELADHEKPEILRRYLRRWKFEVGAFFEGASASSSDEELLAVSPRHPVFRVVARPR